MINKKKLKLHIKELIYKFSPSIYLKLVYRNYFGKDLNLKRPHGFNEKLLWLMLNWRHPLLVQCADKFKVREYVRELNLEHLLPRLIGVYNKSSDIDWDQLPNKFVLKCNHGARFNLICKDKDNFDIQEASKKLDKWLEIDYGYGSHERHYSKINRKIICEEFLDSGEQSPLNEYNVYCFNGVPKVILVYVEGTPHTENKIEFYNINWEPLEIGRTKNNGEAKKPSYLNNMIDYSKKLSKPFPFVRVDFYALENKPVLGELTFTSSGGLSRTYTPEGNELLGEMLTLPEKYRGNYN